MKRKATINSDGGERGASARDDSVNSRPRVVLEGVEANEVRCPRSAFNLKINNYINYK